MAFASFNKANKKALKEEADFITHLLCFTIAAHAAQKKE
jgi:uncharacterized protein HemY